MKLNIKDLKLSGKGFTIEGEFLFDNIKINCDATQFHELISDVDENIERFGWIVPNSFVLTADMTAHTEKGMRGKSSVDNCEAVLIYDRSNYLSSIVPQELTEINTDRSKQILEKVLGKDSFGDGTLRSSDTNKSLVLISTVSQLVFVQTPEKTVRIQGDDGIYVLERSENSDRLTMISSSDGIVHIDNNKNISISSDGIVINDKLLDIQNIVKSVSNTISSAMSNHKFDFDFGNDFAFDF